MPRRLLAEFVGTFAFLFAVVASTSLSGLIAGTFGVAITQGVAIALMITAVAHISGAHFNPAVTLGFLLTRKMGIVAGVAYVITQLVAAVAAVAAARQVLPAIITTPGGEYQVDTASAVTQLADGVETWQGLLIEALLTFFLVWVVFATAVDPNGSFPAVAGFGIGLTVTVDILMGGPLTGASMNPARSFGPALLENQWNDWWLYWVGPLLGGAIAALLYVTFYLDRGDTGDEEAWETFLEEEAVVPEETVVVEEIVVEEPVADDSTDQPDQRT